MRPNLDLSVVILSWNSARHIECCIRTIVEDLVASSITFEIFVVDNGSQDETRQILNRLAIELGDVIQLILLNRNMGTTVSRNIAFRSARGQFLATVDSDAFPLPGSFSKLISRLKADPKLGMAVPRLTYPDGRHQKSTDMFPTIPQKLYRLFFLRRMEASVPQLMEEDVEYAIAAFWVFKRELLKSVGFLDERIFYAPEDADFCLRVWKAGFRIRYIPATIANHHTQELSRFTTPNRMHWLHLKGLGYFFIKHNYFFRRPSFTALSAQEH